MSKKVKTQEETVDQEIYHPIPGVGTFFLRRDKNFRTRRREFENLGRSQRAKVIKSAYTVIQAVCNVFCPGENMELLECIAQIQKNFCKKYDRKAELGLVGLEQDEIFQTQPGQPTYRPLPGYMQIYEDPRTQEAEAIMNPPPSSSEGTEGFVSQLLNTESYQRQYKDYEASRFARGKPKGHNILEDSSAPSGTPRFSDMRGDSFMSVERRKKRPREMFMPFQAFSSPRGAPPSTFTAPEPLPPPPPMQMQPFQPQEALILHRILQRMRESGQR